MRHFSFDSSQLGLEPCPSQMSILLFPSLGDCIPISSFLDRASSRIMWLPSQHGWTPNTIIPMTWPLCYTGHLFSKSTQFRHGGLFHVWVPLFGRIGQLPPDGFQISMAPLKQWTLKLPVRPSATSSLYSPLYLTYTTRSTVPLCFNRSSRLPATQHLFLL